MSIKLNDPWRRQNNDGLKIVSDKPRQCEGCPLHKTGRGFVPGTFQGQPLWTINEDLEACLNEHIQTPDGQEVKLSFAKLGICGEAPAVDELLQNRPFSGAAGNLARNWVLRNAGVEFDECVVDNAIRCVQMNNKLPDKDTLAAAVKHCARYDRWSELGALRDIFTFHPSSLFRDIVPLPLVIHDVGRAREMSETSPVKILMGGTAIQKWHKYATSVARWRGHVAEAVEYVKAEDDIPF